MIVRTLVLGPAQTNCYLVGDEVSREAVAIDPGWDADAILAEAQSTRLTIKAILLTHGHFDHIGAVADMAEALQVPLIAHALEIDMLDAKGGADLFGFRIRAVPQPDRLVEHGETIELGALKFEVRHVPGHTAGHVAFVEHRQRLAFVPIENHPVWVDDDHFNLNYHVRQLAKHGFLLPAAQQRKVQRRSALHHQSLDAILL